LETEGATSMEKDLLPRRHSGTTEIYLTPEGIILIGWRRSGKILFGLFHGGKLFLQLNIFLLTSLNIAIFSRLTLLIKNKCCDIRAKEA